MKRAMAVKTVFSVKLIGMLGFTTSGTILDKG